MAWFIAKTFLSAVIIAGASWLAGRRPILAGFIIALPLVSMLSLLFSYIEYRDMDKAHQFALSIVVAVPLSLSFFIPFILYKWLKLNFIYVYALAIACVVGAYFVHKWIFKT